MRFEKLTLQRFGHFTDFELNFGRRRQGEPDLHVLYGPNEAGKSTTLAAIVDLLYGIERQTAWNFLHDNDVLELQATLQQADQSIELTRFKNHWANSLNNRLERFPLDLQGLSREDYMRRFSFDEHTLQLGSEQILSSGGDVGQALFSASAGLADLKAKIDNSLSSANQFWMPKKRVNLKLTELKKALVDIKKQMDVIKLDARELKIRNDKLQAMTDRRDKYRQQRDDLQRSINQLEKRKSALSLAAKYRKLIAQRDAVASDKIVSLEHERAGDFFTGDAARKILDKTRDQLEECRIAQSFQKDLQTSVQKLQERIDACKPDEKKRRLTLAAERIANLSAESSAVYEWQKQQAQCQSTIRQFHAELASARERLSLAPDSPLENRLPGLSLLTELKELLDEELRLSANLKHAENEQRSLEPLPEGCRITDASSGALKTDANATMPDIDIAQDVLNNLNKERLYDKLADLKNALLTLQHELQTRLAKFDITDEQLTLLTLPDTGWLNDRLKEIADWDNKIAQLNERIRMAADDINEKQTRCAELALAGALDPAQLSSTKESRDNAWVVHSQALDNLQPHPELQQTARVFEKALQDYDALQIQATNNNQTTTELQLLQGQLLKAKQEHKELITKHLPDGQSQRQQCMVKLKKGVNSFYHAETIDADILRSQHAKISDIAAHQDAIELKAIEIKKLERKSSEQCQTLLDLLKPLQNTAAQEAFARLGLEDLSRQAERTLKALKDEQTQQRDAARELSKLVESHAKRHAQVEAARQEIKQWQKRWTSLTKDTLFSAMQLSRARDTLAWIGRLSSDVKEYRDATQALEELNTRTATRDKAVTQLLEELDKTSLEEAVSHLQSAIVQSKEYEVLQADMKDLIKKGAEKADKYKMSLQAVESLKQALLAETDEALMDTLRRTEQHRKLQDDCVETLMQLRNLTESDSSDEHILGLCQDEDAEAINQQLSDLNAQLSDAVAGLEDANEKRVLANREKDDIGDESRYSRLNQERQNLILQVTDLANQCAIARTGQKVLNAAMARFRQEHQSVILSEAQQAFKTLTVGRYVQLLPRDDGKGNERLYAIDLKQKARAVTELSMGTRYQLYLALRAAAHADYATQRTPLPFVADDIMETFDDERAGAAFEVLGKMAQAGQVIYLTHHQHLISIAQGVLGKNRVQVHYY